MAELKQVTSNLVVACGGSILGDIGGAVNRTQEKEPLRYDKQRTDLNQCYESPDLTVDSAGTTFDLRGGSSLTDPTGLSASFARIKRLVIKSLDSPDSAGKDIVVGNAASNPWLGPLAGTTPTQTIPAGGVLVWEHPGSQGWSVGAGATDNLLIKSSSGTAKFRLLIEGNAQ